MGTVAWMNVQPPGAAVRTSDPSVIHALASIIVALEGRANGRPHLSPIILDAVFHLEVIPVGGIHGQAFPLSIAPTWTVVVDHIVAPIEPTLHAITVAGEEVRLVISHVPVNAVASLVVAVDRHGVSLADETLTQLTVKVLVGTGSGVMFILGDRIPEK